MTTSEQLFLVWCGLALLVAGFLVGGAVGFNAAQPDLKSCAREHNVYECTLQAVPVAQPAWVSNGESE